MINTRSAAKTYPLRGMLFGAIAFIIGGLIGGIFTLCIKNMTAFMLSFFILGGVGMIILGILTGSGVKPYNKIIIRSLSIPIGIFGALLLSFLNRYLYPVAAGAIIGIIIGASFKDRLAFFSIFAACTIGCGVFGNLLEVAFNVSSLFGIGLTGLEYVNFTDLIIKQCMLGLYIGSGVGLGIGFYTFLKEKKQIS